MADRDCARGDPRETVAINVQAGTAAPSLRDFEAAGRAGSPGAIDDSRAAEGFAACDRAEGGFAHATRAGYLTVCGFTVRRMLGKPWSAVDVGYRCAICHRATADMLESEGERDSVRLPAHHGPT